MATSRPLRTLNVEADSLEEARRQMESQIPEGLSIRSESIVSDGRPRTATGIAETLEEAYARAQTQVPAAHISWRRRNWHVLTEERLRHEHLTSIVPERKHKTNSQATQ